MVTQILKTKLLMWDIGKNLEGTRKYIQCKEPESKEQILQCTKVLECIIQELIDEVRRIYKREQSILQNF